ncbi:MAG TPA: zinc ribbon domain-containing protein [Candidatus Paceibacterota bacterium]|nr:zinc ribbon domain-containing protein [Candidatus Paceibacterota bacterium]
MYCEHCGTKKEKDAIFCQSCGKKTDAVFDETKSVDVISPSPTLVDKDIFYSKEWRRKNVFVLSALPPFDVMVDDQYLYLIKLPKYSGNSTGLILGFLIGNILGAAIGSSIGESSDTKKRQWYRSAWLDSDDKLTSRAYEHDIFAKIPVNDLKNNITFIKSKFVLNYQGEKITFGRRAQSFRSASRKEGDRLNQHIQKYVL